MHLLTRVHGGENAAASRYAIVHVDRPFANQVLAWRTLAQQCKRAQPQFYRVTFWAATVHWFGADAWTRIPDGAAPPLHTMNRTSMMSSQH